MSALDTKTEADAFGVPAWMLAAAQHAEKMADIAPGALAKRMQETRAQIEANTEEHQKQMRLLGEKLSELGTVQDFNVFKGVRQLEEIGAAEQAKIAAFEVRPAVITTQPKIRKRKILVQKPEERRIMKDQVRKMQMKEVIEKEKGLKGEPVSAVFAESSTTGGSREHGTKTTATSRGPGATDKSDVNANKFGTVPPNDLVVPADGKEQYPIRPKLPEWYTCISLKHTKMEALAKKRPQELTTLDALKSCIKQCQTAKSPTQLAPLFDDLRDYIHKAEIALPVTEFLLRKANMLSPTIGLPLIFTASSTAFPDDLKADSYQLYTRWYKGDFNPDLLRGIETSKEKNRTSDRISLAYRAQFPNSAKYYGQGDLVPGQWWPTQLCTVRDGAHGSSQGGIFGEKDRGAYSIVLSGGHSTTDHDAGTTIEYSGTAGSNFCPTDVTLHMLHSHKIKNPIRVLRSAQLPKTNPYRPEKGIRYDGLYVVTDVVVTHQGTAMHRFRLERCEGAELL